MGTFKQNFQKEVIKFQQNFKSTYVCLLHIVSRLKG